jgi:transglutaminase-like putative cysteine protease
MHLHIRHETLYRYGEPVKRSVQTLRLTPRRDPLQRAVSWSMSAPGRHQAQIDAYGNVVHLLTIDEPHREIRIVVNGIVETLDSERYGLPNEGELSPLIYLASTVLTKPNDALHTFAARHLPRGDASQEMLLQLAEAVCETVQYETGSTAVHEPATVTFARGKGVCQDHAHIFVACCRSGGIPARYVSGYLFTGDDGHVASHAWVDVWLESEQKWLPIDVTHSRIAASRYCRLAVGRDYLDACPIRGVRRGGGTEDMEIAVIVADSAQQQ